MENFTAKDLYDHILVKNNVSLSEDQDDKLRFACQKSIAENPHLDFHNTLKAVQIYLNLIREFPQLTL